MKRPIIVLALAIVALLAVVAFGAYGSRGSLSVSDARSNACKSGDNCGVYLTIANSGSEADMLMGGQTGVADRVELHTAVMDDMGGMKMTPVENIPVPASGSVELKPGSFHAMLFNLNRELKAGDTFSLTLQYQRAGDMTVQVTVQPAN